MLIIFTSIPTSVYAKEKAITIVDIAVSDEKGYAITTSVLHQVRYSYIRTLFTARAEKLTNAIQAILPLERL